MKVSVFSWLIAMCLSALFISDLAAFTPSGGQDAHPSEFPGYVRIGSPNIKKKQMQCSAVKIANQGQKNKPAHHFYVNSHDTLPLPCTGSNGLMIRFASSSLPITPGFTL